MRKRRWGGGYLLETKIVAKRSARCISSRVKAAECGFDFLSRQGERTSSVLPNQHLCRLAGACLAFVRTIRTKIVALVYRTHGHHPMGDRPKERRQAKRTDAT